jgi:DNA-directed RNA polymerase specialized sigma24 family protein
LDPVLELTPAEVELRALCWTRLGRALCRALDLESKAAELGIRDTRQIGAWSVAAVPVLVTLEIEREVFGSVVASLANRLQRPFILLVPTHRALDARGYEALAQARAGCFALDSIVRFTAPGVLQPVRAPGELFQVFTPQPKELDQDLASRLRSLLGRLDGETFEVFRLYCIEALSAAEIARRCRTSKTTVLRRLKSLRQQTGVDPQQLRTLSPHLSNIPSICQTRRFC